MNNERKPLTVRPPKIKPFDAEILVLNQPDKIEELVAHLSCGGTLIDLAEAWGVRFAVLAHWIDKDDDRAARYQLSILMRDEYNKEKLRQQLMRIATLDVRRAFKDDGTLKPIKDIPAELMDCVSSLDIDEIWEGRGIDREQVGVTKRIKFWSKLEAIIKFGNEYGLFKDTRQLDIADSLEDLLAKSWQVNVSAPPAALDAEILPDDKKTGEGGEGGTGQVSDQPGGHSPTAA